MPNKPATPQRGPIDTEVIMASKLRRTRNATKLRTYRIAMAVTSLLIYESGIAVESITRW